MRLIDANELLKKKVLVYSCFNDEAEGVLVEDIENAPIINPEDIRPKEEWLLSEMDFYGNRKPICNVCKEYSLYSWNDYKKCKFCPNCGAKMEDSEI